MFEGKVAMTIMDYDKERAQYVNFDLGTMVQKPNFDHFFDYRIDDGFGINNKDVPGFEL